MSAGEQQSVFNANSYEGLRPQTRGTVGDPIPLSTAQELVDVLSAAPTKFYYLTDTIDLLDVASFWELPLPTFNGGLDGRGRSIIGLQINTDQATNTAGFFTRISTGAHLKNFHIELGSFGINAGSANGYKGVIAPDLYGILENIGVTAIGSGGLFTRDDRAGGIVGITQGAAMMRDCWAAIPIHGTIGTRVGGGVGFENMDINSTPGCWFDSDIANTTDPGANNTPIARTTAQAQAEGTTSLWNKISVWSHDAGNYPVLRLWDDADYITISNSQSFTDSLNVASATGMYRLAADIDLGGAAIEPHDFYGLLDGHGYEIKNFRVDSSHSARGAGLFGIIERGCGVSFLGVAVASVNANDAGVSYAAPLAGWVKGVVDQCYARSCHVTTNSDRAAGFIGVAPDGFGSYLGNNYAQSQRTGNVSTRVGGMLGFVNTQGMANSAYFDSDTWGDTSDGQGRAYGVARVTSAMMNEATYVGWDFADVFQIDNPGSGTPTMNDFRQDPRFWYPHQNTGIASGTLYAQTLPQYKFGIVLGNAVIPKVNWFNIIQEGQCDAIEVHLKLAETASGDFPRTKGIDFRIWQPLGGGNGFAVVTSNDYAIVSTGHIYAESLNTGSSGSGFTRYNVPMQSFYLEIGSGGGLNKNHIHQDWAQGYVLEAFQTAGNSDNGVTGAGSRFLSWAVGTGQTHTFGNANISNVNTHRTVVGNAERHGYGFDLLGVPTYASSHLGDAPIGQFRWDVTSDNPSFGQLGGNDAADWQFRGIPFIAVGSQVTRAGVGLMWDGTGVKATRAFIAADSNGFANRNDILGSSQTDLASNMIQMGAGGNFFSGDLQDTQYPVMYVFSTPVNVTSGTQYWFLFEGSEYVDGSTEEIKIHFQQGTNSGDLRSRQFRQSNDETTTEVISGQNMIGEIWMKNFFEADADGEAGAVIREFPTGDSRAWPTWLLREKHKP